MQAIVISDIHGNLDNLNIIVEKMNSMYVDKLIVLGDFCNYGSNSLEIADTLKLIKDKIIAVKGNADTDYFIEYSGLYLPVFRNISWNDKTITITHGNIFNEYNLPQNCGEVLLTGHTHKKFLYKRGGKIFGNPGSIGRPRDGIASYMMITDSELFLYSIDDQILDKLNLY